MSEKGAPAELNVTVHYFMISESYDVSDHLSDAFLERRSFTIGFQRNSRMRRSRWTKRCSPSFDAFGKLSLILITCIVLSCPVLSCPLLSCRILDPLSCVFLFYSPAQAPPPPSPYLCVCVWRRGDLFRYTGNKTWSARANTTALRRP